MTRIAAAAAMALLGIATVTMALDKGSNIISTPAGRNDIQAKPTKWYVSKSVCSGPCHGLREPLKDDVLLPICRCIEVNIWDEKDKHKLAHKALRDPRAKKMGELLHADVISDPRCISCHGVLIDAPEMNDIADTFKVDQRIEEGVTCGVCHGFYKEWIAKHGDRVDREDWRKLSRQVKQADYGMTDLWNPVVRTHLCASCHIGNVGEGKVVTHEMYAAGHPPLPSFEVVTFSEQLPKHWQLLANKNQTVVEMMGFKPNEVKLEQTNLFAVGALEVLRESLELIAKQPSQQWPELANYDCYACHHELTSKSWRQERGYAGKPGRPPMREWPAALVTLGLSYAATDAAENSALQRDFQAKLAELQRAFDAQPFGIAEHVKATAADLSKWIKRKVDVIHDRIKSDNTKLAYRPEDSRDLLSQLLVLENSARPGAKVQRRAPDYDSARQLAMAFQVLHLEVASKHGSVDRNKLSGSMAADEAWQALAKYLRLTLPVGPVPIGPTVEDELKRIGKYEPREFFKKMDAVLKQFKIP